MKEEIKIYRLNHPSDLRASLSNILVYLENNVIVLLFEK